ncbi:MAG: Vitamin B12 import ATP-binding protein BtuD [Acidimicrobiales bacterium]|nr:MAG: ATP-binding cassette domain-containing protein [Actinomycetota bacterium]MBV6509659.1 Vitamin B12 import ATP-binding protein BtuD [Acidimicrobiales bacterium]RIK06350.1 MAG: hypothetical protein DCC48_07970 [Acidobacteriota bacterium]
MSELVSLVLSGAVAGGIYAIMASGLVLTYQTSGIFNFAHGAIAFSTAFVYFQLNQPAAAGGQGLPIVVSALVAILVFAPLLGLVLDRLMMRRLSAAPEVARLVGTIGLLIALPALLLWIVEQGNELLSWGLPSTEQVFQPPGLGPTPALTWNPLGYVTINTNDVAVFGGAAVAALLLWLVLRHTRFGLQTRASVDRRDLARARGVDVERMSAVSWMLSTTLAGLAGVLIAPLFQLDSLVYTLLIFAAFGAVVFGNMRSIPLAFAGGIALGVAQNLIQGYAPELLTDIAGFRTAVAFMILLALLIVKGGTRRDRVAGSVAEDAPPPDHRVELARWRRWLPWITAIAVLVVYVQWVADDFWVGLIAQGLVLGLVFLSFVVVTGMGGMVSLAQATFVTAGGFMAGWLVNHQWPLTMPVLMNNGRFAFLTAALVGAAVAAAAGLVIALPSLRLGGLALALATLALAFMADQLVFQVEAVRNGSGGWSVTAPSLGPVDFADDRAMSMLLLAVILLITWGIHNLRHSATGRAILATRSSEVAASSAGVSPMRAKLSLFALSAAIAGFGGAFYAAVASPITSLSAPAFLGLVWLAVAVTFGVRRPGGAVVGGLVFALMPSLLTSVATWESVPWTWIPEDVRAALDSGYVPSILFGLAAINLAREPDGILALAGWQLRRRRRRAAASREVEEPARPVPVGPGASPIPALRVESLRAAYGDVEVLHGIDVAAEAGSLTLVLGPNGAGKSTLTLAATGLLTPSGGRVWFGAEDVTGVAAFRRARRGLFLVPEARGVFPGLSVEDNLAIRLPSAEERQRAYEQFPVLGERRRQRAELLSGGEQQMLALAGPLVRPPSVLVVDEPSLGLSPLSSEAIYDAVAELRDRGTAVLVVEEKAQRVLDLADSVVVIERGRVSWSGPASDTSLAELAALYLGDS